MEAKIIPVAIVVTRIAKWLLAITFSIFLIAFVYLHVDAAVFENWHINSPYQAGTASFRVSQSSNPQSMAVSDIEGLTLYWQMARLASFFLLVYLILHQALQVLKSARGVGAFHEDCSRNFRHMAFLGLIYAILYSFNLGTFAGETLINLKLPFSPLLFTVACLVLSAIFQEGNRLSNDSKSII
jgi:hypothetical protein